MKNKGFTLIELLAVIVILAIIALIATPIILNMINNAKKSAAVDSAYGYIEAIEYTNSMTDLGVEEKNIPSKHTLEEINDTIKTKGSKTTKITELSIENGIVKRATLCINGYIVEYDGSKAKTNGTNCNEVTKNYESIIMLDVARRYYTVDEIKQYVDILSVNKNSTLQIHFTDDENVGIESVYLDQTVSNATYANGIYTNPNTNKNFLSFEQVKEIITYAKSKNVRIIPEIDVPAHMNGFFTLAELKFGTEYVRAPYNWDDNSKSGLAPGKGAEIGNIDLMAPNAKPFIKNIYDEYTTFFKEQGCEYFSIGFDEYSYRPELKKDYINELYMYLNEKGLKVRMWSDSIIKENMKEINNKIEIMYWFRTEDDAKNDTYASIPELQKLGFKIINANSYYLFFVPSSTSITEESLNKTVNDIKNIWTLEKWKHNLDSKLESKDNILGAMITIWGEDSLGISNDVILKQTKAMYNEMYSKLK